ncbi:hypothetical protein CDAR_562611 [Caerostris darwini]|uniref:Uncharacterized protein n=1 Tax=Caerostris darwini TaxID=1538125 RepID=A0AAV4X7W8_9ARAC|nr:hypothetical protein CDAR_562611 [Caerostris darwini]
MVRHASFDRLGADRVGAVWLGCSNPSGPFAAPALVAIRRSGREPRTFFVLLLGRWIFFPSFFSSLIISYSWKKIRDAPPPPSADSTPTPGFPSSGQRHGIPPLASGRAAFGGVRR